MEKKTSSPYFFGKCLLAIIAAAVYLVRRGLKTDITPENKKNCLYFFASVPMVIFTLACLGICVG